MTGDIITNKECNICDDIDNPEIKSKLSEDEYDEYKGSIKVLNYTKGEIIIQEGSVPKGIYCVKKGTAKLYKSGFNGKEQILRFANSGEIIGYRSILCHETFSASATALDDMVICFIPENVFLKLLEISPRLAFEMLNRIAHELGEAGRTITLLAQKTVRERLAEIILLLEKKIGTDIEGYINISLTREEMANLIGTATESAIRLISEFKSDNLIEVEGRRIKILDHQKLSKLGHVII